MNFGLSEEQILLSDSFSSFLKKEAPLDRVRQYIETGADPKLQQQAAELGISGIMVAQDFGGSGLGLFEAALVSELLGQQVTPSSFITTSVIAPTLLNASTQTHLLEKIATGEVEIGFGCVDALVKQDKTGKITTQVPIVMGFDADYYLIGDRVGNTYLLDANDLENASPLTTIDQTRNLGEITCSDTPAIQVQANQQLLGNALSAGRVMLAADTLGAAQYMLDASVSYAKQREQFGQVIGSFQAVKHMCAEMVAALEPCRAFVWYSAHLQGPQTQKDHIESSVHACQAKAHIDEMGQFVARTATEVHGGMGFTDLLGLHLWFKRIGFNRQNLGSPTQLRAEAGEIQGFFA